MHVSCRVRSVGVDADTLHQYLHTTTHPQNTAKKDPGRWSAEEHMLFLQGLQIHGKSWKKISEIVKTRTVVQIRTHAQKYLIKLEKAKKAGHNGVLMMDGKGVHGEGGGGEGRKASSRVRTRTSLFVCISYVCMRAE